MSERPAATRERILEAAEGLMLEKSYHSVGLKEILEAVRVPKGSFYHYFASKEQFGVELLRHYVAGATAAKRQLLAPVCTDGDQSPIDALERLMASLEVCWRKTEAAEGQCPCLVVKLASEVAGFSESMRLVLEEGVREWVGLLEEIIREGIETKVMASALAPRLMAAAVHDLWTGAMQRAATNRSGLPLQEAQQMIRHLLTAPISPLAVREERADSSS